MGFCFVGKGDVVLKKETFDQIKRYGYGARSSADSAVTMIENANGPSKDSPFREGLLCQAHKDVSKAYSFMDALINVLDGAKS